ncbi:glucose-6-phosphate isomerase [bacterium BMS3Abin02]|nr:glucose-6-phosphate isomerase [bacterium BMS3Abin02]
MDMQLGAYETAVRQRLRAWDESGFARRLWAKDPTLWFEREEPEIVDRLGWLTLPDDMAPRVPELTAFGAEAQSEGIRHVVLLGMGGSSLAPEVFQRTLGSKPAYPSLIVLDSTHPDAVRAVDAAIDPAETMFVVSSKSGTTLETLSGFRYFWSQTARTLDRPGRRFVAVTDPGSPLEDLAKSRVFRAVFSAPADVGGRYSALTMFGLVPAALIGVDLERLLDAAATMAHRSGPAVTASASPGLRLGAAMGELALAGRDKLTFLVSPTLRAFPDWLEQLVAESTGKDGKGIVPIAGEPPADPGEYGQDRLFVSYHIDGEPVPGTDGVVAAGHPLITIPLAGVYELSAEMFRAEMATAAAGSVLGIHPFNQPDVQLAKTLAREAMEAEEGAAEPIEAVRLAGSDFSASVSRFLGTVDTGDYVALQAYVPRNAENESVLQRLRIGLRARTGAATTVGFGPRFLHSTGQLHKGGANNGVFIQIVDEPSSDVPVPEVDYSFGKIIRAQADGDYRAMRGRGRRVLRIDLGRGTLAEMEQTWPA